MEATVKEIIRRLRAMVSESDCAKAFFLWNANYEKNTGVARVDQAIIGATQYGRQHIDGSFTAHRSDIIHAMKALDEMQLGRFIVGRRGQESRFEFWTPRSQIGRVALRLENNIDVYEIPVELALEEIVDLHRSLIASARNIPLSAVTIRVNEG